MSKSLRVGIIGASAEGGWARESHVVAVQKLAGLELAAVAGRGQAKAEANAKAFGAKAAYGDAADLIRDKSIDIVSVCVGAPAHRQFVLAALAAGKHVYCEWPLGRNTGEAEEMLSAARVAKVRTAVGLQTRGNPTVRYAHTLIASGIIGRVLSSRVYSTTIGFGPIVPSAYLYLEEPDNGVNLVTIQGGHTLDLAVAVLGGLADLTALNTTQYPQIEVGDDHTPQSRTTSDHMLVQARLAQGGALSLEVAGGRPPQTPFRLEVMGDKGVFALEGGAPRGFQSGRLYLSVNGVLQSVDEGELAVMPDTAANVAGIYAALRDDIQQGTSNAPDFQHAVRMSRVLDGVMLSARNRDRTCSADWPTQ